VSAGANCLARVERARRLMADALAELESATHAVKANDLGDGIDARALAVARTNLETAELWAARAVQ
jgi:hypothetical protein